LARIEGSTGLGITVKVGRARGTSAPAATAPPSAGATRRQKTSGTSTGITAHDLLLGSINLFLIRICAGKRGDSGTSATAAATNIPFRNGTRFLFFHVLSSFLFSAAIFVALDVSRSLSFVVRVINIFVHISVVLATSFSGSTDLAFCPQAILHGVERIDAIHVLEIADDIPLVGKASL
jgi:hypothetical protein